MLKHKKLRFSSNFRLKFKKRTYAWELQALGELANSFEYGLNAAAVEFDGKNKYLRITDVKLHSIQSNDFHTI
jgi:hypothetical protein